LTGLPDGRREIGCFQAGASDQRTVDVGDPHQFGRIRGFYGATIENPDFGPLIPEAVGQNTPDKPMNLLDILRSRCEPGADRPDRLIGHHQIGRGRAVRQRAFELGAAEIQRLPGIALRSGLADADDGN